ncbi:MAG: OmpA family protein [Dissulfurispiraceae bacterium]|jgi:chemotaxis protein MotB|nr:OmpA family protein [Dissulfurispiraceae bacterium]
MSDKSKTIIVKKIKKGGSAHHGGSWKVAYADFVTAMMAFFLMLWLLAMVSPEKRAALSEYFKNFSIFKEAGQSMMSGSTQIMQSSEGEVKHSPSKFDTPHEINLEAQKEKLKEMIRRAVEQKMAALKDQVIIDVVDDGIRIQIVDTEGGWMFAPGSAQPTERANQLLGLVAGYIKESKNRIAVEGHTDASPSKGGSSGNWELSSARASSARKVLENNGLEEKRIERVVGYADNQLLIKDKPNDARNRRISIILLHEKMQPKKSETKPTTADSSAVPVEQKNQQQQVPVEQTAPVPAAPEPVQHLKPTVQPQKQPVLLQPEVPLQQKPVAAPAPVQRSESSEQKKTRIIDIKPGKPIDIINKPVAPPDFNK